MRALREKVETRPTPLEKAETQGVAHTLAGVGFGLGTDGKRRIRRGWAAVQSDRTGPATDGLAVREVELPTPGAVQEVELPTPGAVREVEFPTLGAVREVELPTLGAVREHRVGRRQRLVAHLAARPVVKDAGLATGEKEEMRDW